MTTLLHELPDTLRSAPQTEKLLWHLRNVGGISPVEALMVYGITRLAARIYDLKRAGHDILAAERADPAGKRYTRYVLSRS